ncbi:MAG TPA: hypothetical protein VNU70_04755 [Puia sp.]|jgi:hypothetical protein|nr:hypothetical protein [Puia sp.]
MRAVIAGSILLFLSFPAAAQNQSQQTGDEYTYDTPPGWTPAKYPDGGVVMSPPVSNTGERCTLSVLPVRQSSGNLAQDAVQAFREIFSAFALRNIATRNSVIRGVSAQGWEYFMIKNAIQVPGGNYQMMFGFVFVAGLGNNRIALIAGMSKDPLVSSCYGLNLTDVWPKFYYSLHFRSWNASPSPQQMMRRMAGVWTIATATVADRWVFAPNGRYASAAASQRYVNTSSNEILGITDAYFGNGTYSLEGARIVLTNDNDKANPKKGWIRMEQESYDNGNTWTDKLYLLRTSIVDGKEFEVAYHRQK